MMGRLRDDMARWIATAAFQIATPRYRNRLHRSIVLGLPLARQEELAEAPTVSTEWLLGDHPVLHDPSWGGNRLPVAETGQERGNRSPE